MCTTKPKITCIIIMKSTMYAIKHCNMIALRVSHLAFRHDIVRKTYDCSYTSRIHFARKRDATIRSTMGAVGAVKPPIDVAKALSSE